MNDAFEKKVRAAAAAGWRVFLVAAGFLTLQWLAYLTVMNTRPGWLLSLWGPAITWDFVQNVWFWVTAGFKIFVWLLFLAVLWLTLWARQLRKADRQ